jgi:predicted acetyltransferase
MELNGANELERVVRGLDNVGHVDAEPTLQGGRAANLRRVTSAKRRLFQVKDGQTTLRLRPLTLDDEREALAAHAEAQAEGYDAFLLHWDNDPWSEYLARLADLRRGIGIPDGLVPATFLVADVDSQLVGRTSIRHSLNDYLLNFGGHIGYAVRPAFRRRGYATEVLRQSLIVAHAEGVTRALVTCDDDNLGSIAVIERAGGKLEDIRLDDEGVSRRRYWID